MNRERHGPWYLLTGVVLGFVLGLLYTWTFSPSEYADTHPDALRSDYKDAYRAAIASAYSATDDLTRAKARLALLVEEDPASVLAAQSQRYLAEGYSYEAALALARLSAALGDVPAPAPRTATTSPRLSETPIPEETATQEIEPTPSETEETPNETTTPGEAEEGLPTATPTASASPTPTLTRTAILTFTPLPTRTLTPTLAPPFVMREQALVCESTLNDAVIQIVVQNAAGEGIPGVEIIIHWDGQEEYFFTGLKPEMGWGYADYTMTPETSYTLHIGEGGEAVDLFVPECSDDQGERYWGSWRLVFTHP
ncbi:MAG: hypothetical protein ISS57_18815 [Anaerolineales bacterium]|nr:hypothetical protein [Anaerolineales bacterium]